MYQGGAGGSWWICEHACPDKTSQAFPESRQGLGTIHPGNKSGSRRRDPRMRERGTRELGQALGSVLLEQEGQRWKEGSGGAAVPWGTVERDLREIGDVSTDGQHLAQSRFMPSDSLPREQPAGASPPPDGCAVPAPTPALAAPGAQGRAGSEDRLVPSQTGGGGPCRPSARALVVPVVLAAVLRTIVADRRAGQAVP